MLTQSQQQALRAPQSIGVRSPAFNAGRAIPREYTGLGDDVSPPLEWTAVPDVTRAIAIVVDDPDAPGHTFTHWTAWNIGRATTSVHRDADIKALGGIEGRNDFGSAGYRGPKPPSGTHRYYFRVFALDEELPLAKNATVEEVWRHLARHTIAWGELMGTFTKP